MVRVQKTTIQRNGLDKMIYYTYYSDEEYQDMIDRLINLCGGEKEDEE